MPRLAPQAILATGSLADIQADLKVSELLNPNSHSTENNEEPNNAPGWGTRPANSHSIENSEEPFKTVKMAQK